MTTSGTRTATPYALAAAGVDEQARRFHYALSSDPHVVAACGRLLGV